MIKTYNGKILNVNKGSILSEKRELELRSNKETRLNGSNVEFWSDSKNGWFFKAPSGKEPSYNNTEKAIEFTQASGHTLESNKWLDYSRPFVFQFWVKHKSASGLTERYFSQYDYPSDANNNFWIYRQSNGRVSTVVKDEGAGAKTDRIGSTNTYMNNTDWNHYLIASDGLVFSVYFNGELQYCFSFELTLTAKQVPIGLGKLTGYTNGGLDGFLDDVSFRYGCPDYLVAWSSGSGNKYTQSDQVFTPPPRQFNDTIPILQLQSNVLSRQGILLDSSNNVQQWNDVRNKDFFKNDVGNNPSYDFTEQAVKLDRTNSEYLYSENPLDYANKSFILSFWIKLITTANNQRLIQQRDYPTTSNEYISGYYSNSTNLFTITFAVSGSSGTTRIASNAVNAITDTNWHHILVYYDHDIGVYQNYIDGKIDLTRELSITAIANVSLYIGRLQGLSGDYGDCYIDDFICKPTKRDDLIAWNGSVIYSSGTKVFTPKPRNFPYLNA